MFTVNLKIAIFKFLLKICETNISKYFVYSLILRTIDKVHFTLKNIFLYYTVLYSYAILYYLIL